MSTVTVETSRTEAPQTEAVDHRKGKWPIYGALAGVTGTAATWFTSQMIDEATKAGGVDAVYAAFENPELVRIGASLGFLAIVLLAAFAAGFTRFVEARTQAGNVWVGGLRLAFAAVLGSMTIGFSLKAMLAGGMPGGIDAMLYTKTDVAVLHLFVDQLQWACWWAMSIVIAISAAIALKTDALPKWLGWMSIPFAAFVFGMTIVLALPYSAGIAAGPWLVVAGLGLLRYRSRV